MKRALPFIVGGAIAAVYFASRKRGEDSTDERDIEDLMRQASDPFNRLIDDLAGKNTEARAYYGPLLVTVTLRVSGFEKMFVSESDLKKKARSFAKEVQALLPSRCPGAPKLIGEPLLGFKDVDGGYKVSVTWPAQWGHTTKGLVKEQVRACMEKIVRENKDVGGRVKSLTAIRTG